MFGQSPGGANLAGLIWADDLFQETGDQRYRDLIIDAHTPADPGPSLRWLMTWRGRMGIS